MEVNQESTPLVSILCLSYNHSKYIRETLEGLVKQETNFTYEIIVHDDASTDNSQDIIREFDENYPSLFRNIYQVENQYSKDIGRISEIIYGEVRGKYVAFCEGDDYWIDPLKLQKQVDFLEKNDDYSLVYTDAVFKYESSGKFEERHTKQINSFNELLLNNSIWTLTTCFRSEALKVYCESFLPHLKKYPFGDYSLWLYILLNSKAKYMPFVSSVYRILSKSASHSVVLEDRFEFVEKVYSMKLFYLDFIPDEVGQQKMLKLIKSSFAVDLLQISLQFEKKDFFDAKKEDIKEIYHVSKLYYIIYLVALLNFNFVVRFYKFLKK